MLKAVTEGLLDGLEVDQIETVLQPIRKAVKEHLGLIARKIESAEKLSDEDWQQFVLVLKTVLNPFAPTPENRAIKSE